MLLLFLSSGGLKTFFFFSRKTDEQSCTTESVNQTDKQPLYYNKPRKTTPSIDNSKIITRCSTVGWHTKTVNGTYISKFCQQKHGDTFWDVYPVGSSKYEWAMIRKLSFFF